MPSSSWVGRLRCGLEAPCLVVGLACAALCFTWSTWSAEPVAAAQGSGFTEAERGQLERGALVARPRIVDDGGGEAWLGGVSFQVVDRPIAEVWRALQDVPAYRHMLPATDLTRLDGVQDGASIVYLHQSSMGAEARYWVRMRPNPRSRSISFELDPDRPHDVQSARGFLELRPYPRQPHRTLVTWGVRAQLGAGALGELFRDTIQGWLLRVPAMIKGHLEGAARDSYLE